MPTARSERRWSGPGSTRAVAGSRTGSRSAGERAGLDARDRAFAQRLAYGAIQRLRTIDHLIQARASRPVDAPVLDALRLGVLQLVWMDSVPDRAAVDQTVELVKADSPRAA